jgi:hypothetical protein
MTVPPLLRQLNATVAPVMLLHVFCTDGWSQSVSMEREE